MSPTPASPTGARRILVTGATGTVGREVVRALASPTGPTASSAPACVVRVGSRAGIDGLEGVEHVRLDFDDPATFAPAFEGVDAFFFVSPLVERQVPQAEALLRAAVAGGVRHCVRLSSRATGWDEVCILRRWHREIEARVKDSGLTSTMLRPCSFMQNVLGASLALARSAGVFSMPLGSGRIAFVDAHDLGDAAASCLRDPERHAGQTYVLTGGEALDGNDLAGRLAKHLDREVRYVATSPELARTRGRERGLPDWLVESGLRVYAHAETGAEATVDPTLATLLGRAPTAFEAFLERATPEGPEVRG